MNKGVNAVGSSSLESQPVPQSDRHKKAPQSDRYPTRRPPATSFEIAPKPELPYGELRHLTNGQRTFFQEPPNLLVATTLLGVANGHDYASLGSMARHLQHYPLFKSVENTIDFPRMNAAFSMILSALEWGQDFRPAHEMNALVYGAHQPEIMISLARLGMNHVWWRDVAGVKPEEGIFSTHAGDLLQRIEAQPAAREFAQRVFSELPADLASKVGYLPVEEKVEADLVVWNMPPDHLTLREMALEVRPGVRVGEALEGGGLLVMQTPFTAATYLAEGNEHRCHFSLSLGDKAIMPIATSLPASFQVWQIGPGVPFARMAI